MTTYAEGDRLRITIEATVQAAGEYDFTAVDEDGDLLYLNEDTNAVIELIERADNPSKDPVGTLRSSHWGPAVKVRDDIWVTVGDTDAPDSDDLVQWDNGAVAELGSFGGIIGSVPGTPAAAAAEKPEKRDGQSESSDARPIYDRAVPRVFQRGDSSPEDRPLLKSANGQHTFRREVFE